MRMNKGAMMETKSRLTDAMMLTTAELKPLHPSQVCITCTPRLAIARCKSGTARRITLENKNNV
jgi:hypothetical protein